MKDALASAGEEGRVPRLQISAKFFLQMVGVLGFEPRTSSLSGTRSNQLSYTPGRGASHSFLQVNPVPVPTYLKKYIGGA